MNATIGTVYLRDTPAAAEARLSCINIYAQTRFPIWAAYIIIIIIIYTCVL